MAEIFVLVDHANGQVRKTTNELLTIAARLGEPSAIYLGPGAADAQATLAKYGAKRVYALDSADVTGYLVAPQAEFIAALAKKLKPAAILIPANPAGKEIGARVAIKTDSGLITDAIDVQPADGGLHRGNPRAGSELGGARYQHRQQQRAGHHHRGPCH